MKRAVWLCAVTLIACKSSATKPENKPTGSGSAVATGSAKDPWQAVDASVVPETPETRKKRAEEALARVEAIEPKLAKLRDIPFDKPVPTAYQTTDDFRKFVHREIEKDLPPEKSKNMSAAFLHMGLLTKPMDLGTAMEQTMVTQAAAYYDPVAKKFFMVMVPDNELLLDTMSAHELTHGLQDQRYDLQKFMAAIKPPNDDAQFARQALVEGDATFTMFLYAAAAASKSDTMQNVVLQVLRAQIDQFAKMDLSDYGAMMKQQAESFTNMDPDIKKSMEAMDQLPPIVMGPLLDSYMKGARVVLTAYDKGGWKMVDALYKQPPDSSEQILHPDTKLFPTREEPKKVTLPKLPGEVLTENTLGELLWQIYFSQWVPDKRTEASEGWGGDRYTVVKRPDGSLVAYIATVWDTPADAAQFAEAFEVSIAKRFPNKDRKITAKTEGNKVFILDGDDDAKLFASLIKQTKFS